jgi:hypothetical protein
MSAFMSQSVRTLFTQIYSWAFNEWKFKSVYMFTQFNIFEVWGLCKQCKSEMFIYYCVQVGDLLYMHRWRKNSHPLWAFIYSFIISNSGIGRCHIWVETIMWFWGTIGIRSIVLTFLLFSVSCDLRTMENRTIDFWNVLTVSWVFSHFLYCSPFCYCGIIQLFWEQWLGNIRYFLILALLFIVMHFGWKCGAWKLVCKMWWIWIVRKLNIKCFEGVHSKYVLFRWNNFGSQHKCPGQKISTVPGCRFWINVNQSI